MIPRDVVYRFITELARRHRGRQVDAETIRRSVVAYAKCYGIAHGIDGTLTRQQMRRAMAAYRQQMKPVQSQPELLSA